MFNAEIKSGNNLKTVEPAKNVSMPGELGATIELIVFDPKETDPQKREKQHRGPMRSESFLQQFIQLLFVKMAMVTSLNPISVRDTSNALINVHAYYNSNGMFWTTAAAGLVTNGIIIGTGNTAPTIADYKIETIIPHATMNYSALTIATPAADATTAQITQSRNFSNVSGGNVTVNEAALYCQVYTPAASKYFCIIRDVIAGGITVPNGQTLTVNYRVQAIV